MDKEISRLLLKRNRLTRTENKGDFWKPCPGTCAGYLCCGYQIITPLTGCGMYCAYCVLQVYLENQGQVLYENLDSLDLEITQKMALQKDRIIRFGTGEFADSLYLEPRLHLCERIASVLEPYENVVVEFKTKSNHVDSLAKIQNPSKVIAGFSLSTERNVRLFETNTASIEQRIAAARKCEEMGFFIAFHFDPMIWYPEWEKDYRETVDRVFSAIKDPRKIAWWSMGGLRSMPSLKKYLEDQNRYLELFSGEMVTGEDGKLRYFRPIRTDFYSAVLDQAVKHYPDIPLYLCMESREVWEECGMLKRIPDGLSAYLDKQVIRMKSIE
jgi:spore photoproduct lyase